jgi:hypothetical protein
MVLLLMSTDRECLPGDVIAVRSDDFVIDYRCENCGRTWTEEIPE